MHCSQRSQDNCLIWFSRGAVAAITAVDFSAVVSCPPPPPPPPGAAGWPAGEQTSVLLSAHGHISAPTSSRPPVATTRCLPPRNVTSSPHTPVKLSLINRHQPHCMPLCPPLIRRWLRPRLDFTTLHPFYSHSTALRPFDDHDRRPTCVCAEDWINKLCGRPPQYAHASCDLDLLTSKVVSESRVT